MKTYQIELNHGKGSKSWIHFSISDLATQSEIENQVKKEFENDYLKEVQSPIFRFSPYKVSRKVLVREYDSNFQNKIQ